MTDQIDQKLGTVEATGESMVTYNTVDWVIVALVLCSLLSFIWFMFKIVRWLVRRILSLFRRSGEKLNSAKPKKREAKAKTPTNKASKTRVPSMPPIQLPISNNSPSMLRRKTRRAPWVLPGSEVTVAGRKIGGMVYVGTPPKDSRSHAPDNAFIDPKLSVDKRGGDWEGVDLSYWPNYSHLSPLARATYLDWMAEGRKRVVNPGYMFLFFYGLERRFFKDKPQNEEKQIIIAEVTRLRELFSDNRSASNYLSIFLDAATLGRNQDKPPFYKQQSELPLLLKVGLARRIEAEKPLDAQWLRAWYMADSETRLRTPARRCGQEFESLFDAIFERNYPKGLPLRRPKRKLVATYCAASGLFEADLTETVGVLADISSLRKPLTVAAVIAEEATDALEKFSRLIGKNSDARGTLAAHAMLPVEIRSQFTCAEADAVADWADSIVRQGGGVNAVELLERLTGASPDKLTRKQLTGASDTLLGLGIGMAPDPRFALRGPKYGEPVILFELPPNTHVLEISEHFGAAALRIGIATMIAQVDDVVDVAEEAAIDAIVAETPNLSEAERIRLSATARWMRSVPPDIPMMRKRLKAAPEPARAALAKLAVEMAAADGSASKAEVGQLEKLFKTLGLDPAGLYSALHVAVSDEPVLMRAAKRSSDGPVIPAESKVAITRNVNLDLAKVAKIGEDTHDVSVLLGDIFGSEETENYEEEEITNKPNETLTGLTSMQAAFVRELASRDHWSESDFVVAAKNLGLMPSGALEAINEWSFALYDRVYLDEYNGYDIDPEIAAEVGD